MTARKMTEGQLAARRKAHRDPSVRDRAVEILSRSSVWLTARMIAERIGTSRERVTSALVEARDEGIVESRQAMSDMADTMGALEFHRVRVDPNAAKCDKPQQSEAK